MFTRYDDYDRTLSLMDALRRRMDRVWNDFELEGSSAVPVPWPRLGVFDAGSSLVVKADVPGMSEKDIQLTLNADSLAIVGERRPWTPEGYSTHRQERSSGKFSRSVTLPCKVDAEQASAVVRDGVLTITLTKAHEARPRQIAIQSSTGKGGAS